MNVLDKRTWFMVIVFSILYALARFPGLESHSGYYGMAYSIIHPESFPHDITGRFNIAMVSWYTLLVKICGNLWLDDRFNIAVYAVLVGITTVAALRIMQLFEIKDRLAQLAVLAVLCGHHTFIGNVPHFVDAVCYRPSTYAYPIGIWLVYFLLKGNSWKMVTLFAFLLVTVSFKNGWFIAFFALLITIKENMKLDWKKIAIISASLFGLFLLTYGVYLSITGKVSVNAALFNNIMQFTENDEANPLVDGIGPYVYLAFLGMMLLLPIGSQIFRQRLKEIWIISLIVYVAGALYYTFAPDIIKVPFFLAMAVERSTWMTQIIMFLVLSCFLIQKLRSTIVKDAWIGAIGLVALYAFPIYESSSFYDFFQTHKMIVSYQVAGRMKTFFVLLLGMLITWAFVQAWGKKYQWSKQWTIRNLFLFVFIITLVASFAQRVKIRQGDLKKMVKYGVIDGDRGGKWIGVNDYIRDNTSKDTIILALDSDGKRMYVDTSLRIRTGRSMVLAHEIAYYFNYEKRLLNQKRFADGIELANAWSQCDMGGVKNLLPNLRNPDYIIVPTKRMCDPMLIGFTLGRTIGRFAILKRDYQ